MFNIYIYYSITLLKKLDNKVLIKNNIKTCTLKKSTTPKIEKNFFNSFLLESYKVSSITLK